MGNTAANTLHEAVSVAKVFKLSELSSINLTQAKANQEPVQQ